MKTVLSTGQGPVGVEFGSTRIKAVVLSPDHLPIASGQHGWENSLKDGVWTYSLDEVWSGLQAAIVDLKSNLLSQHDVRLTQPRAIGISGMMHGYMVFDREGRQLTPFRTWRNTMTSQASEDLTRLFNSPIPQRWSIAHLYQAILNGEEHVARIAHITTLAGYVHWKLTGRRVVGVGEASGIFPIDSATGDFDSALIAKFDALIAKRGFPWLLRDILPEVLSAGHPAGELTPDGAARLDPTGAIRPGIPFCPPEGDAGTGMVATNSVAVRTGNVSAGTSVFAMLVLEKPLTQAHPEIDLVMTPDGKLVGMVHSNNCTSDIDAWIELFAEAAKALGAETSGSNLYSTLLGTALDGDPDCGGLLTYGYVSGEHITHFNAGRPLVVRSPDSTFTLANFFRAHLFSSLCALRTGLNVLFEEEHVQVDEIRGHGGFFKTPGVGQRIMAAATGVPVSVLETAGEGGAWGIALLAAFTMRDIPAQSLPQFLEPIFAGRIGTATAPDQVDIAGFERFFQRYQTGLAIERAAVETLS